MHDKCVAHAIVGWNQIEYLANAIDSVLNCRAEGDDVFVYVTGGDPADHGVIKKKFDKSARVFLRFIDHDHSGSAKVGSLYCAYNKLMDECKASGYKYLNLIQSDFQLLWWDAQIIQHYMDIFQLFENALQINTGFVRRGSHPTVFDDRFDYRDLPLGDQIPFVSAQGIGDWGFLHLERVIQSKLTWSGTESSMASNLARQGFVLPFSRIPCAAPIPWPAVIRNGEELGSQVKRSEKLLLRPKRDNALACLKMLKAGPLWQEEWVTSWGWWSMQPTWATEFTPEFFSIQSRNSKNTKLYSVSWTKYGEADVLLPPLLAQRRPGFMKICHVFFHFVYKRLKDVARRWIFG